MGFYDDLKFGQDAERLLLEEHPYLAYTDGRKSDLSIKGTKILIEKKADSYDMHKYGNFIIERYGSGIKDGGPFSALKNGCKYFVYTFVKNQRTYVFETVKLVARVKKLAKKLQLPLYDKVNASWTTRYYKVKITDLEDLDVSMDALKHEYNKALSRVKAKRATKCRNS